MDIVPINWFLFLFLSSYTLSLFSIYFSSCSRWVSLLIYWDISWSTEVLIYEVHPDLLKYLLIYWDTSWTTEVPPDLLRYLLNYWGTSWSTEWPPDLLRYLLIYWGISWSTEWPPDLLRYILIYWGTSWSTEVSPDLMSVQSPDRQETRVTIYCKP
jgi:hypothetical protein